jgi:anti-anti-sigma factor
LFELITAIAGHGNLAESTGRPRSRIFPATRWWRGGSMSLSDPDPRAVAAGEPPPDPSRGLRIGHGPAEEELACGEIDPGNAHLLAAALQAIPESDPAVVDLTGVTFLGSAAVAILYEHTPRGLQVMVRAGTAVARVMDICGLPQVAHVQLLPHPDDPPPADPGR